MVDVPGRDECSCIRHRASRVYAAAELGLCVFHRAGDGASYGRYCPCPAWAILLQGGVALSYWVGDFSVRAPQVSVLILRRELPSGNALAVWSGKFSARDFNWHLTDHFPDCGRSAIPFSNVPSTVSRSSRRPRVQRIASPETRRLRWSRDCRTPHHFCRASSHPISNAVHHSWG
jgi:hypothetical protein